MKAHPPESARETSAPRKFRLRGIQFHLMAAAGVASVRSAPSLSGLCDKRNGEVRREAAWRPRVLKARNSKLDRTASRTDVDGRDQGVGRGIDSAAQKFSTSSLSSVQASQETIET